MQHGQRGQALGVDSQHGRDGLVTACSAGRRRRHGRRMVRSAGGDFGLGVASEASAGALIGSTRRLRRVTWLASSQQPALSGCNPHTYSPCTHANCGLQQTSSLAARCVAVRSRTFLGRAQRRSRNGRQRAASTQAGAVGTIVTADASVMNHSGSMMSYLQKPAQGRLRKARGTPSPGFVSTPDW